MLKAADLGRCHGGVMRIRRAIIVPAILTFSTTGSILAISAVPMVAAQASSSYVLAAPSYTINIFYHT
jgi:hypothetical protein